MTNFHTSGSRRKSLPILAAVAALVGVFGLAQGVAIADSNETAHNTVNAYVQASISAGGNSTCVIESGTAKCWGDNSAGQLGNNSRFDSLTPVSVSGLSSGVTSISAGISHTCAVVSGAARCWGDNSGGQLGNNSTVDSLTPVSVSGLSSGVTAISVGGQRDWMTSGIQFSCAVVSGAAKCWGDNSLGQLGDNSTMNSTTPVPVTGLSSGVTGISVGHTHACAVVSGAAKCWGANSGGQLGNNSTDDSLTPVSVSGLSSGVTVISVGGAEWWPINHAHSCAVVSGAVKCWGTNGSGQLGNNSTTGSPIPVSVSGLSSGVFAVSVGNSHGCAATETLVKCWGGNGNGQAGPTAFAPIQVRGLTSGVTAIAAGMNGNGPHVCAIQSGGLKCWGHNMFGQLGKGDKLDADTPQQVVGLTSGVTDVHGITCAVKSGAAKCWGTGDFPRISAQASSPVDMFSLTDVDAITGGLTPCVLRAGAVQCWGFGAYRALGNGSSSNTSSRVDVTDLSSGVTAISANIDSTTCAVQSGAAKCWGYGASGQLGNALNSDSGTPVEVTQMASGVTSISVGSNHVCAVQSGAAKCWGQGSSGQLGNGLNSNSGTPVQVVGLSSGVTAVAAGESHSCAIVNGGLKCWGQNSDGSLGNGLTSSTKIPNDVLGMSSGVTAVSLTRGLTCAVQSGAAKCWGSNVQGQLGNGSTITPVFAVIPAPQIISGVGTIVTTTTSAPSAGSGNTTAPKATTASNVTVAQGQASIATVAPNNGSTKTVRTPFQNQTPQTTTTSIPSTVTTLVGDENGEPPSAPAVAAGEAIAVIDGKNVSANVTRSNNQITAKVGGITATFSGLFTDGERIELDEDGNLRLEKDAKIVIESSGFEVNKDVEAWMFSTPSLLGKLSATATGAISGTFDIPSDLQSGDHRLVLKGVNNDGEAVVLGIGMMYGSANSGSSVASRLLIGVPVALAVLIGLFIPAVSRRRRKQDALA